MSFVHNFFPFRSTDPLPRLLERSTSLLAFFGVLLSTLCHFPLTISAALFGYILNIFGVSNRMRVRYKKAPKRIQAALLSDLLALLTLTFAAIVVMQMTFKFLFSELPSSKSDVSAQLSDNLSAVHLNYILYGFAFLNCIVFLLYLLKLLQHYILRPVDIDESINLLLQQLSGAAKGSANVGSGHHSLQDQGSAEMPHVRRPQRRIIRFPDGSEIEDLIEDPRDVDSVWRRQKLASMTNEEAARAAAALGMTRRNVAEKSS